MIIFLYEFVTGGGWWSVDPAQPPAGSLYAEGAAMGNALAHDFAALPGIRVVMLRDARLPPCPAPVAQVISVHSAASERRAFEQLARGTDRTLVIAPEFAGYLAERARWVDEAGGKRLSPSPQFVELTANKHETAEYLVARGVPAVRGWTWQPGESCPGREWPLIIKPLDGAGSMNVRLLRSPADLAGVPAGSWRLEPFCPGLAASVAFLSGPRSAYPLVPARQLLSDEGAFRYLGTQLPLPPGLARRATALGERTLAALPSATGYVGMDLVLGEADDGGEDRVIEVNPR
ncbi:MAG: ATP-grasp domain-containing protein, partial [Pirellulaceae bacterium]